MPSTVSSSRKRGMGFILMLTVVAVVAVGWLLVMNVPDLLYEAKTEKAGKILDRWDEEKWQEVYEEVQPIFFSHLPRVKEGESVKLNESDLPPSLRDLGFDYVHATSEGVYLMRMRKDANLSVIWVHCIYQPAVPKRNDAKEESYRPAEHEHDRKGIWFHGFREQRWAYETSAGD